MKKFSKGILIGIILLGFSTTSLANPLSNLFSIFQRDLVINVQYTDHKNLIQGSDVYLAQDPKGQKTFIGSVTKISFIEPAASNVEIIINKEYKEKIYETTRFVLIHGFFAENSKPYIIAIPSLDSSNQTHLKSGASVKGFTFWEYKFAVAGEELTELMENFREQNGELLNQLEQYIKNFDTEAFQKQMDDFIGKVSNFSAKQKETFKKEVLPSLRKTFESMMEKLEEQNNIKKSKELEKQLSKIEKSVDV
nr:hypothetical protein [uncultured Desulfobacter sp.]